MEQLLELGDYSRPKPKGYFFTIQNWVKPISNKRFNINIDPKQYFITSGEAIIKCAVLEKDLWDTYQIIIKKAVETLRAECDDPIVGLRTGKLFKIDEELQLCLTQVWHSACQARHLMIHLTEARGSNLFLETDWAEGQVVCYPKNPRGVKL